MDASLILSLVKQGIGISTDKRDDYYGKRIQSTIIELESDYKFGVDLSNIEHMMFVADYVIWQIENQGKSLGLPIQLKVKLKNHLIKNAG